MPTVWIPSLLRDLAGGREKVDVSGSKESVMVAIELREDSIEGCWTDAPLQ